MKNQAVLDKYFTLKDLPLRLFIIYNSITKTKILYKQAFYLNKGF